MIKGREVLEQPLLDVSMFTDECKCINIGTLSQSMVDFIVEKRNDLNGILKKSDILLWNNRIEYTSKHKYNFRTSDDYNYFLQNIPNIISNPDYVGLPPHDLSIQFIKKYELNIIVAVRISTSGKLSYRTMYPITDSQLKDYQNKNRAWKYVDKTE